MVSLPVVPPCQSRSLHILGPISRIRRVSLIGLIQRPPRQLPTGQPFYPCLPRSRGPAAGVKRSW